MPMLPGDNITIQLKGFELESLQRSAALAENGSSAGLQQEQLSISSTYLRIWWRYSRNRNMSLPSQSSSNALILQFVLAIGAGHTQEVLLPRHLALRLPHWGLRAGALELTSDSSLGPIFPTFGWSAGLGTMHLSSLAFSAAAGVQSAMVLVFCLSTAIESEESLSVMLPGFTLTSSLDPCGTMRCNATCDEECVRSIDATSYSSFQQCLHACSGQAVETWLVGQPIAFSEEVEPAGAAEVFAMNVLGKTSVAELYAEVHYIVTHSWINGSSLKAISASVTAAAPQLFVASAQAAQGGVRVRLESNGYLAAGQLAMLVVSPSLGIKVPSEGFPLAHNFTISSQAEAGLMAESPIAFAPSVGTFHSTRVTYAPAGRQSLFEGELSVISISFALNAQILAGETIKVYLPGFSRVMVTGESCRDGTRLMSLAAPRNESNATWPNLTNSSLLGELATFKTLDKVFHKFLTASWNPTGEYISLTASATVRAREQHTVTVPCEAGMVLTKKGLSNNDQRVRIASTAKGGLVVGQRVGSSPRLQAVCGLECGGLFAARAQMQVEQTVKGVGVQASLPTACASISKALSLSADCACGNCPASHELHTSSN